ncbi:MAG: hypothetical protein RIS45_1077 [Planctomycetota bacterium]|jgi:hypothetical protein
MTILSGYVQNPFGGWVADTGTGPYFYEAGADSEVYRQLPSGLWVKGDGSGPYFYDPTTGQAVAATGLFRSTS